MTTYRVNKELFHNGRDYAVNEQIPDSEFADNPDLLGALVRQGYLRSLPPEKPPKKEPA